MCIRDSNDREPIVLALTPQTGQPGLYRTEWTVPGAGMYRVTVEAYGAASQPTRRWQDEITVQVGNPSREYEQLEPNTALLQNLAEVSGGRYVHVSRLDTLVEELVGRERRKRILYERPLSHPLVFWLAALGLVTAEWWNRQRYRLR